MLGFDQPEIRPTTPENRDNLVLFIGVAVSVKSRFRHLEITVEEDIEGYTFDIKSSPLPHKYDIMLTPN